MELVLIIIGILIVLGLLESVVDRIKSINWRVFISVFTLGSILLAVIFNFTAEGVLIIVGAPQRQHSCILNPESPRGPVLEQLNATLFVRT
jgi:hypothetical protein